MNTVSINSLRDTLRESTRPSYFLKGDVFLMPFALNVPIFNKNLIDNKLGNVSNFINYPSPKFKTIPSSCPMRSFVENRNILSIYIEVGGSCSLTQFRELGKDLMEEVYVIR